MSSTRLRVIVGARRERRFLVIDLRGAERRVGLRVLRAAARLFRLTAIVCAL